jgi:hypothetical protein
MAGSDAIGWGRTLCELELADGELLAEALSLEQAPSPRAALRAMPATSSFLAESVDEFMASSLCGRCRSVGVRGHSGRPAELDCAQSI